MHVVVTDRDATTARTIIAILADAGHSVTFAQSAVAAFRCAIVDGADALLLDTVLPDLDAIQLCHELRTHGFAGVIMFLSHDQDRSTRVRALRAGADDFIMKPFDFEELLARLEAIERRVRRHAAQEDNAIVSVGPVKLSLSDQTFQTAGHDPVRLTPTEMRVLELLMRSAWTPVSRDSVNQQIWGMDITGNTNPVEVYIRRLRRKIEPCPEQPQYLRTVRGHGYVFVSPDTAIYPKRPATSDDDGIDGGDSWHTDNSDPFHPLPDG